MVYGFEGGSFVDLIQKKAFKTEAQKVIYLDTLPSGSEQRISTLRENLMEVSAEGKDEYIEKYSFRRLFPDRVNPFYRGELTTDQGVFLPEGK